MTVNAAPLPARPGQREFVALVSVVMMMVAFAIDSMLVALPLMGRELAIANGNHMQLVIGVFMLGFGIAQFFVGMVSDRFGRRGILLWSLFAYLLCSLVAATSVGFEQLLIARFFQGIFAAGGRVVMNAIVRDYFSGRAMARVMSLAAMIFMAAPILAPLMGQAVMAVADWRWIFVVLALFGLVTWVWVWARLPESLAVDQRRALTPAMIAESVGIVARDRQSLGYAIAIAALSCGLMGYLMSVPQIFDEIFHRLDLLPHVFALIAGVMAACSLANSRLVMRYGMRLIGHSALIGFTLFAGIHALVAAMGIESLIVFTLLQGLMMACFSFSGGNFSALAMEHMGKVAGMATSLQGSFSTIVGAGCGALLGQLFDGTVVPLYAGIFAAGLIALVAVYVTERGELFVARNAAPL